MNGKELDLSKIADMISKTAESARDKLENQSDKMYSVGEDMMSSVGDGALSGAKNAAKSIEAAGDIITTKYQKVLDEINRSGKKKGDIASLFATMTQIKRSDLNSFNALKDELKNIKATFTDIGEVKGLDAILKQYGKTADKLRSIDFGFGSAFVARGRVTGTKNLPHVDEVEKVETSLADAAQQSRKTAEIIQSNNIKQIQSFQDLVNLLTEYKRLIGSIKEPKLPQLYEDIETVKANLEIEGSRIQQRDMAKREIQARYKHYQNERKAYDNGGSYVSNGQIYDVSSYTDLARSEEYLKVLIALYIRCGGEVDKLSKKVKQFAEDNDIVGVLRETEEEYRNIINETSKQNRQTIDNIHKIRESVGYKEDGSNTSLAIGEVLNSIHEGANIEEAADALSKILNITKEITTENEKLTTSEKKVADTAVKAASDTEKRLKASIDNQKDWLRYLDRVLNDDNFVSTGKKDATDKLKARTQSLIHQRTNPDESSEYATEMAEVAWKKAYDEAERQGVARSTLTRFYTDAGAFYEQNLSKLQEEYNFRAELLAKEEAELATIQRTTTAIGAENAELERQQKIVNSSADIKKFQDEYAKAAKNHAPEDMGRRYGYLMEAISGDSPTMSAVDALNELIAKEQEWKAEQEAALEAGKRKAEEMKTFIAASAEYQYVITSSKSLTTEYAQILQSISNGSMSATEGMEAFRSAIERCNAETEEAVPSTQQQSEAEQAGGKAATEAAEAHRDVAAAMEQEATAAENLSKKQYKNILSKKDMSSLLEESGANSLISIVPKSKQKGFRQDIIDFVNASFNNDTETASDIYSKVAEMLDKYGVGKTATDKTYAEVWDYLKGITITIPEDMEKSFAAEFQDEWKQIKRRYGGNSKFKIRVGKGGIGVDQEYEELKSTFPGIFSDKNINVADQLRRIIEVAEMGKAESKLPKFSTTPLSRDDWGYITTVFSIMADKAHALQFLYNDVNNSASDLAESSERTANSMERQAGASKDVSQNLDDSSDEENAIFPIGEGLNDKKALEMVSTSKKPTLSATVFDGITSNDQLQTAFQSIIKDVEQQSMTLVKSDILDSIDRNGVGTLKFVSDDMNHILVQTWKMVEGQLTLASEKYTSIFKEPELFDVEDRKKVAKAQAQTLRTQFKGFADDPNYSGIISGVETAAGNITDAASFKKFNVELTAAREALKQLKAEMSSSKSLDPLAAAEKTINKLPFTLEKIQVEYKSLKEFDTGDIFGAEGANVENLMDAVKTGMNGFNDSTRSISDRLTSFKDILKAFDQLSVLMSTLRAKAKESSSSFAPILNTYKELLKLQEEQKKAEVSGATDEKKNLISDSIVAKTEKLKQLGVDINDIDKNTNLTTEQRNKLLKAQEESLARIKKIEVDAANSQAQKEKRQSLNYGKGAFNSETRKKDNLSAIYSSIEDNYGASAGLTDAMNAYLEKYKQFETARQKIADPTTDVTKADRDAFNKAKIEVESARKALEIYTTSYSKLEQAQNDGTLLGMDDTVDPSKLQNSTDALKAYGAEISNGKLNVIGFNSTATEMYGTIDRGKGIIDQVTVALESSTGTLYAYKTATKEVGTAWEQFKGSLSRKAKELSAYIVGGGSIYGVINQVKKGISYVKEIDAALTELKKVTDETDATYKKFLTTASQTAGQIGSTVKDFTNATADFARLGYNIEQASDLAKAASVYYHVGDDLSDIGEASDSIISTMHGFGIEAENAMNIVDKFNEVGNNFAISSSGIGQALLRSASALSEAGNTIDESIGLITAANSVVQNPEAVGTAMKTLSLRIRGAKVELEDAGEDVDGMANSVSELQKKLLALTGGKVNIMLDENTFKNTTEILREMSAVWDDMTDVNRAAALELLGGKRQANVLAAVIKNFKTVEDVIQTSSNSAGSALKENSKYMDSIQGRVDRFTNSLQTMWMNALNSDAVKLIVDVGNGLINIIDKLGLINTLAGAIAAKFAFSNKSKFGNLFTGNLSDVPSQISEKLSGSKLFSKLFNKSDISQFVSTAKEAANSVEMVGDYAVEADGQLSMFTQSTNAQSAASAGAVVKNTANAISEREVGAAATTASFGVKMLNAALGFGIGLLASIAVTGIIKGIDSIVHHAENLKTEVQDLTSKYQEAKKEFSENLESLSSLTDTGNLSDLESEFASLTKGVNANGENVSLTSDQYERYKAICEQIVGIQPSIAQGYDSATEAIGNNASALENLIELQKAEARLNAKEFVSDDNLSKILEDNKNTLNEAMDEEKDVLSDAKRKRDEIVADIMQDITSNYGDVFDDSVYNSEQWLEIANEIGKGSTNGEGFLNALKNALDSGNYSEEVKNVFRVAISDVEAAMLEYSTAAESASKKVEDAKNGMIDTLLQVPASMDEYDKLSSSGKSFITEWIKNSDAFKIDAKTSESAVLKMKQSIKDMVYKLDDEVEISLQDGTKATLTGQDILDRIVEIDPSSVNYGEYKAKINELLGYLFQALGITDEKTQNQIKVSLGVDYEVEDENGESKNDNLSEEIARVTGKSITDAQSWLDSQPAATVNALYEVKWSEVDGGSLTDVDLLAKANGIQVEDLQDSTKLYSNNEAAINGIKNSISEYEEALNKLDEGSFTLEDFNKLIAQYPDLAKGVDKSSKSFRGLRTNLKNAIKAAPKSLIKSLKSLREQLVAVGGDTTAIDQLIKQVEAIPNDTIDALSDSYITLEDSIQKAKDAQDELNSAMSEDTNTGYTTRAGAMDEMKELMGKGAIGSESKLWNIADEFGFSYDYSKTIEDNADALAAFIAQRQRWYELGEDNDSYSYDGMSAFATDMSSIADQLGIIWEYQDGLLNFDFHGKTFDEIASGMTAQGISMTTEELVDLMTQLGQFHMINWETPDDLVAYFNAIKEGSMTASDQLTQMKSSIETMLKNKGIDVDWSNIDSDGLRQLMYQAGYTGDAVEALISKYQELKKEAEDPLEIGFKTSDDAQTVVDKLETINELKDKITKSENGTIFVDYDGLREALKTAGYTEDAIDELIAKIEEYNAVVKIKPEDGDPMGIKSIISDVNALSQYLPTLGMEIQSVLGADGSYHLTISVDDVIATLNEHGYTAENIQSIIAGLSTNTGITLIGDATIDTAGVQKKIDEINAEQPSPTVSPTVDQTSYNSTEASLNYLARDRSSTVKVTYKETNSNPAESSGTVKWWNPLTWFADGTAHIRGTAHAYGTADAHGDWGATKSETALTGELGPEIIVRGNKWFTVGDHGAEFTDIQKGDIIFNHKQSESLIKNGYVNSRGKSYASGTAFSAGGGKYRSYSFDGEYGYSSSYDISNTVSDVADSISETIEEVADDTEDKTKQTIDFIEYKLEEIETYITNVTNKLGNLLDDTSQTASKNNFYNDLVSAEKDRADTYLKAAALYNEKATDLLSNVPSEYQAMAKNGAIAVKDFIGENETEIADAIEEYRTWAKKADDSENGYLESIAEISAKRLEQLQDIADDFENIVGLTEQHENLIQAEMDLLDEAGERLSENFYNELMKDSKKQIEDLNNKRASLQDILDNAVKSGDVQVGSDDWYEMVNSIYDVDDAILECKKDIEGFQNSINDLYWDNLDKLIDKIDNVDSELSHLYNLVSDEEKVVDEFGNWTKDGVTALGLLAQQLEVANFKVEQYGDAIARLEKDYAAGLYSTDEYNEKLAELKENQWDAIDAQESAKKSIIDLNKTRIQAVKDGMQKEIDAYSELIDKKKEELNLQKESHDFSKQVAEQQKNIADIEKRLAVISGDNSASAIAQKKKLQAELAQAREELDELYYDHSVEKQQEALDKSLEDYQNNKQDEMDALDESLKNEDQIIQDSYATIAANTESLAQNLSDIADKYGITLSDSVTKPWLDGADAIGTYQGQLDTSMSAFTEQLKLLKQELIDLQVEADKTANSIINATNSKKDKTESARYTPPVPAQQPSPSPAPAPAIPEPPSKGSSVTVKSSATHFSRNGGNGTRMQSWVPGSTFTVYQVSGSDVLIGRNGGYTGWVKLSDIEGYAKGSKSIDKDQFAFLDELGEELQLVPDGAGRLSYVRKGTSIIPADISERLMEWGQLDPSSVLEQSRPTVSAPHIINNNIELNMSVGEVVHIDRADNSSIPNITKAVQDQMDNYMKNINKKLYNRVR